MDCNNYFDLFICTQPGRNGVLLKYVIRDDQNPIIQANVEFLDNYVDQAPLNGDTYASGDNEVHT